MVTLEQLDELEGRILRALELISDLRSENAHLETENQELRKQQEESRQALAERDREIASMKDQLNKTARELNDLKSREAALESKVNNMLSRLSGVEAAHSFGGSGNPQAKSRTVAPLQEPATNAGPSSPEAPVALSRPISAPPSEGSADIDESAVIIADEDLPSGPSQNFGILPSSQPGKEQEKSNPPAPLLKEDEGRGAEDTALTEDSEDISLIDEKDIFRFEEENEDISFIDNENPSEKSLEGREKEDQDPDSLGKFNIEDDDEFLLVEEEPGK